MQADPVVPVRTKTPTKKIERIEAPLQEAELMLRLLTEKLQLLAYHRKCS